MENLINNWNLGFNKPPYKEPCRPYRKTVYRTILTNTIIASVYGETSEQCDKNAHLIASVPDLLNISEKILKYFNEMGEEKGDMIDEMHCELQKVLKTAKNLA